MKLSRCAPAPAIASSISSAARRTSVASGEPDPHGAHLGLVDEARTLRLERDPSAELRRRPGRPPPDRRPTRQVGIAIP